MKSLLRILYFLDLQYLQIVLINFTCKGEGRNIDDVNIRVLKSKYSTDLSILSLLKLFHTQSPHLFNSFTIEEVRRLSMEKF